MAAPLKVESAQMPHSHFKDVDLSGTTFENVDLSGCTFRNVSLKSCDFHDISFAQTIITGSCFQGCEIAHGPILDLRIAGIRVADLLDAYRQVHSELPSAPHPERATWEHH